MNFTIESNKKPVDVVAVIAMLNNCSQEEAKIIANNILKGGEWIYESGN